LKSWEERITLSSKEKRRRRASAMAEGNLKRAVTAIADVARRRVTAHDGDSEVVRVMEDDGRKVLRVG